VDLFKTKTTSNRRKANASPGYHSLKQIILVEVWFDLRKGGRICLPRITYPEAQQQLILHHLGWSLPEQPPPKIYRDQNQFVWTT